MHPPGTYNSAKSKEAAKSHNRMALEAAHCGRFGTLGAKNHKIKDGAWKAMQKAWFVSLVFHLFCKVSSDYRRIKC